MLKRGLLTKAALVLASAGFKSVESVGSRSSFDIIARRGDTLILIKALANVEGLSRERAQELKCISQLVGGIPMVVSERMKTSSLADDVVYDRYGVCVCSVGTLAEIVNDEAPKAYARRGNYCVHVDGGMLSAARKRMGMTQESLADRLGVSKQSVYRYETSSSVSLDIFERMVDLFGDDFARSEFKLSFKDGQKSQPEGPEHKLTSIKKQVRDEFQGMGFSTAFTNAPFDMVAQKKKRVFSVVSNDWRRLESKLDVLAGITDVLDGYTLCISERRVEGSVSVLTPDELAEISSSRELFKLLSQK